MLLKYGVRPLNGRAHLGDQLVAPLLPRRQFGMMFVGATRQSILDASFGQARVPGMRVVGLVAIDRFLIATEQTIRWLGVGDRGIRHVDAANEGVACIHTGMNLVAKHALFAL